MSAMIGAAVQYAWLWDGLGRPVRPLSIGLFDGAASIEGFEFRNRLVGRGVATCSRRADPLGIQLSAEVFNERKPPLAVVGCGSTPADPILYSDVQIFLQRSTAQSYKS